MIQNKTRPSITNVIAICKLGKIGLAQFITPVSFALATAFFEGISVSFLSPLAKGIVSRNFLFVSEMSGFKQIMPLFPDIFNGSSVPIFILLVFIVFVSALFKNVCLYFSSISVAFHVRRFGHTLRTYIFNRYMSFGKLFFDRSSAGQLRNILIDFAGHISGQIIHLNYLFCSLALVVVYVTVMFLISWKLTLFTLISSPILFLSFNRIIKKIEATSIEKAPVSNAMSERLSNVLSAIPLVKLYTAEAREKENFARVSAEVSRLEFSIDKKALLIVPALDIIILAIIILLISASGWLTIKDAKLDISSVLVFFYVVKRCASSASVISNAQGNVASVMGPIMQVLDISDDADKCFVTDGQKGFAGIKEEIRIKDLNFSYRSTVPILSNLSLSIKKNSVTALVGPTGSGKTTIINLLLRFYQAPNNTITIDGVDINEFSLKSLRSHIALVSQDALLFNDTLKANITYGLDRQIADVEMADVLKKARLQDFISALPQKLDTKIGDVGIQLSGGEKQRVSIARALLKQSEILFLDEATSALDSKTEKLIQEAIDDAIKNKTVIVIAHRLSTIKHSDKIVFIDKGIIAEEGTLNVLLEQKGKFYEFWEAQKFY